MRTRDGRILGVLAIARSLPQPAFSAEDLRVTEVLADLAAFALERAQLLDDEEALGRAGRAISATLDPDEVIAAAIAQARELTGAARRGVRPRGRRRGACAAARSPRSPGRDVRVPVALGARLFGVLTATAGPEGFAPGGVARLVALAPVAAAALANALEYDRERRVAHAMTAGFVPQRPPELDDHEVGFVYEPAGREASGGDVFGIWTLPGGGLGLLVGDVSGSGLEVAATAAMVRFFVEARTFDCDRPAEVLAQANAILRSRLPEGLFVPAFLAIAEGRRLRWCNAGHPPPLLLRAAGGTSELGTTGLPLGIDAAADYRERECALAAGDVLVAATDGLWEARRDGVQFGDARLRELLAEHGRALAPQALAERLRDEAHALGAAARRRPRRARAAGAAVSATLRAEPPDGPASRALWAEYQALLADRLDAPVADPEHIFASPGSFSGPGSAWLVAYEDGGPVACGGLRRVDERTGEIKRMFVTARARGRGHGRALLTELERLAAEAGQQRLRLITTDVLGEARALYEACGYTIVATPREGDRQDYLMEKTLPS